jgi:hypothetical protein
VSGLLVTASFSAAVTAPVQYGPHFRSLTLYLFRVCDRKVTLGQAAILILR